MHLHTDLCLLCGVWNHIPVLRPVCISQPGMGMRPEYILSHSPAVVWVPCALWYLEDNWEIRATACVIDTTSASPPRLLQRFRAMRASLVSYSWAVVCSSSVLTVLIFFLSRMDLFQFYLACILSLYSPSLQIGERRQNHVCAAKTLDLSLEQNTPIVESKERRRLVTSRV